MTDLSWLEFKKYPPKSPKGHSVAECNHCNYQLSGQEQRLHAHLNSSLKSLHPSYNPPFHWSLSNNLLSDEYKEIKDQIQEIYSKKKYISLSTDGWSTQHNEPIINYITLMTHGPIFFKSVATETHFHIAEYIAEEIQEVILEFKENFVVLVVTDNATNMHVAWNILHAKFPSILFYESCNTLEIASKITNNFNSHQVVKVYLHETQKQEINKTIALGTQLVVLEKLLESKSSIKVCLIYTQNFKIVIDLNNWDNILALAEVLCPIVKCITKFESDSATLSLVYKEIAKMKDLECNITSPIQDSVVNIISKQFNYIQTPIMLLAYLFDSHHYSHHHFHPTAYALTQLFQKVMPYINNFVPKTEKEIHAGLYREYGELVALLNTNTTLQEAAKELHPHDWWNYKKKNDNEGEPVWLSDIEQEVNCKETNYLFSDKKTNDFWEGFNEHADQVFYDSE
ncbi:26615_t:CDS:2 [Gigaspora margarita]|uniref:26615_t:CDS:1 n=1 Tax=Gigaspora margarita TaxID=4874 RepID=A0ABN7VJ74_GIGMA|nr:26615_t:CDS:2 [Gigaspora margarita]